MGKTQEYYLRRLRTCIGLLPQEPLLFSSSIRDICCENNVASKTALVEASMEADKHVVSNLPDRDDTHVRERDCQLSGGQKQIVNTRTLV